MKTRILLVIDDASNGERTVEIQRDEKDVISVDRVDTRLATWNKSPGTDALVFCFTCFAEKNLGTVARWAGKYPDLPIIVVSGDTDRMDCRLEINKARRLLASVQEALELPKVRRLIRLGSTDKQPAYAALDVRWISPGLQQRYSVALHHRVDPQSQFTSHDHPSEHRSQASA